MHTSQSSSAKPSGRDDPILYKLFLMPSHSETEEHFRRLQYASAKVENHRAGLTSSCCGWGKWDLASKVTFSAHRVSYVPRTEVGVFIGTGRFHRNLFWILFLFRTANPIFFILFLLWNWLSVVESYTSDEPIIGSNMWLLNAISFWSRTENEFFRNERSRQ